MFLHWYWTIFIFSVAVELVHGLVVGASAPKLPVARRASGRQRRAISTLEADVKRYGSKQNYDRGLAGDSSEYGHVKTNRALQLLTVISTLIDTLWRENRDLVDKFLNNEFLRFQAEGKPEDTISSYQYYTVVRLHVQSTFGLHCANP